MTVLTTSSLVLLLLTSVASSLPSLSDLFNPFHKRRFQYEGLINLGALGLKDEAGMVAAVGHIDQDHTLDLFLLDKQQSLISIWLWDSKAYAYKPTQQVITGEHTIINVVASDFNYDGLLDVLVMSQQNPGSWFSDDETTHMSLHLGLTPEQTESQSGRHFSATGITLDSATVQQPTMLDAFGTMRMDLLGYPKASPDTLAVWQSTNASDVFQLTTAPLPSFSCKSPNPHSNAFVDLDGDCLADLFFVCQDANDATHLTFQIWLNKPDGFRLSQSGNLPAGTGQVAFEDMDRDGTLDMVFPSCTDGRDCYLNIVYNQQIPLCTTTGQLACRDASELCVADSTFKFDLDPSASNSGYQRIPLSDLLSDTPYLVLQDSSFSGKMPVPVKVGDYDTDGYPDLLVIASASASASQGTPYLLRNIPCSSTKAKGCQEAHKTANRRSFSQVVEGAAALTDMTDVKLVSFIDIDEQGSLDFLVQRAGSGGSASRRFAFVKNNFYHDTFFFKATMMNGACKTETCEPGGYRSTGASYSGASYKLSVFDPQGHRRAQHVNQLTQTSYFSLALPYSFFGLGRTNNYVENLFVGSTRHQDEHYAHYEGLIPNSQLRINPWQPTPKDEQERQAATADTWQKSLYLHPSDWIPGVTLSLSGALVVLLITIAVLHAKEQREDEAERKKKQALLNFDAL